MATAMAGVVEYVSRDDMKNAIRTLDDTRLGGKYIRVREVRLTDRQTDRHNIKADSQTVWLARPT